MLSYFAYWINKLVKYFRLKGNAKSCFFEWEENGMQNISDRINYDIRVRLQILNLMGN